MRGSSMGPRANLVLKKKKKNVQGLPPKKGNFQIIISFYPKLKIEHGIRRLEIS
jgi:hypothetical protein